MCNKRPCVARVQCSGCCAALVNLVLQAQFTGAGGGPAAGWWEDWLRPWSHSQLWSFSLGCQVTLIYVPAVPLSEVLSEVCVPGREAWWEVWRPCLSWWLCFQGEPLWAASCWFWTAAAWRWLWYCRATLHPMAAEGSWSCSRAAPVPQGFSCRRRGSCLGSAGAQSPCQQHSVAALQARKGQSSCGSGLLKLSAPTSPVKIPIQISSPT